MSDPENHPCSVPRKSAGGMIAVGLWLALLAGVNGAENYLAEKPLAARSGPAGATMFTELPPEKTGIVTENRYNDPQMWGDRYHEFEVGAIGTGVAIGDYDGDGRPDIFVVSKTESCRLFRNLGDWKFEDVTERAGVGDKGPAAKIWKQGATFVDVNNDGKLDLYVCRNGAPNLLYVNKGDATFVEQAAALGLAVNDGSGMAAFCDYDRDGWLDVFIQTNLLDDSVRPNGQQNYLFHNDRGTFTDVTERAGILRVDAQGHSATWWDYDNDGWPDLYVANDFAAPDVLYHNPGGGTQFSSAKFANVLDQVVPHTPYSSMGSDVGDINNDGLIDFFVPDMAATTPQKDLRTMADARGKTKDPTDAAVPQYLHNALFLNTDAGRFQEAAFLAGLSATDWSWSVRFEDLDNDGRLDLHVTNGMHREVHNTDLIARVMRAESAAERVGLMKASPVLAEPNLAYRNLGDLAFQEVGAAWGLNQKGVGFGAAFGDLDGDGDLDLVYANYQAGVTVLRNDSASGHRVMIDLRGATSNRFGIGATVKIETNAGVQIRPLVLARGYLSSSEPVVHFGLGDETTIARLTVTWPSGVVQSFTSLPVDRRYVITEKMESSVLSRGTVPPGQFTEIGAAIGLTIRSHEETVDEIATQPLLPMRHNRRGPALAAGDLDGDSEDELVIAGTTRDPAQVLRQSGSIQFIGQSPAPAGPVNDGPVLVFDANSDGQNDLLITRGGSSLPAGSPEYQPQLLLNTGGGRLAPAPATTLPSLPISVGAVAVVDFDRDGRLDLFVGGRVQPGEYPHAPRSALLANRGDRFEDVTETLAPGLAAVGMVTSALWSDADGDSWPDLLLTLEWGGVKYFHNRQGRGFEDGSERVGFAAAGTGWWNSIASADFNGDGRPDYAVGNLGLNTQYRASPERPALLFSGVFTADGPPLLIEARYDGDRLHPWRSRRDLGTLIPSILKRYPRNDYFARASLGEILGEDKLAAAERFAATEFRSGVFLSQPDSTYHFEALPRIAQLAPIQGLVAGDFDGDGHADVYAVQNSYAPNPVTGRFDGGVSQLLRGDGRGRFAAVPPATSGLVVPGDAKALAVFDLDRDGWPDFVISRNDSTTLAFHNNTVAGGHCLRVRLQGPRGNPAAVGAQVSLELSDRSTQTSEVTAGSGYCSQSTPAVFFGYTDNNPPRQLRVRWPSGATSTHDVPAQSRTLMLKAPSP